MGALDVYGISPVALARDMLPARGHGAGSTDETNRRAEARERRWMYQERIGPVLDHIIATVFDDATVRDRMRRFKGLAGYHSVVRRVTNETARMAYVVPPTRYVGPTSRQAEAFNALAHETNLNRRMDKAAKVASLASWCVNYTCYSPRLKRMIIHTIWPDCATLIPHPDDPASVLAVIYDSWRYDASKREWRVYSVYWDDQVTFVLDAEGGLIPDRTSPSPDGLTFHGWPRIPFVVVRSQDPDGTMGGESQGSDAVALQRAAHLLDLLAIRKLKARGFRQMFVSGDIVGFPKGQIFDEESAIFAPEGATLGTIDSESDTENYMKLLTQATGDVGANRGISRSRLNQDKAGNASDETGLLEQRAEVIQFMLPAEFEQFDVMKMVSREHHQHRMDQEAVLESVDFGEIEARVDRLAQLAIRKEERSQGIRNYYDDIREDNPEVDSDESAAEEIDRNIEVNAKVIEKLRALNMAAAADASQPGQTPEQNGRMGPATRDGKMTKDQAAEMAKGTDATTTE